MWGAIKSLLFLNHMTLEAADFIHHRLYLLRAHNQFGQGSLLARPLHRNPVRHPSHVQWVSVKEANLKICCWQLWTSKKWECLLDCACHCWVQSKNSTNIANRDLVRWTTLKSSYKNLTLPRLAKCLAAWSVTTVLRTVGERAPCGDLAVFFVAVSRLTHDWNGTQTLYCIILVDLP